MSANTPRFESYNESDTLREAEALRAEAIRSFFTGLFGKREKAEPSFPAHVAPAE